MYSTKEKGMYFRKDRTKEGTGIVCANWGWTKEGTGSLLALMEFN